MSATPRQRDFVDTLLRERVVPDAVSAMVQEVMSRADASPAMGGPISQIIDQLKKLPRKGDAVAAPAAGAPVGGGGGFWSGIEKAKYAIPREDLPLGDAALACGGNDHLFVEVREYKGHTYMRQLHGSPGSFVRSRLTSRAVADAAAVLRGNCLTYTQIFGELYACCGVCGAELTDPVSRDLKLGPECRKRFGF